MRNAAQDNNLYFWNLCMSSFILSKENICAWAIMSVENGSGVLPVF